MSQHRKERSKELDRKRRRHKESLKLRASQKVTLGKKK
jgi:hypothetical protein